MLTKTITKEELLIVTISRQIKNGNVVVLGVGLPMLAGAVAKKTHAPEAVLLMESGIVDFEPNILPSNVADATCTRGYGYATDLFSVFTTIAYAGYLDQAFLGVGQIDRFGNINTSYMGNPPEAQRITGAGGAPELYAYARETILTTKGTDFVEKLPYITSPGYLDGGYAREQSGRYAPNSGPSMLISSKGIFRFHPRTREMYLYALFPGVKVSDIRADVPWNLTVADSLQGCSIPTDEEIMAIRRISPASSFSNTVSAEILMASFRRKMEERKTTG